MTGPRRGLGKPDPAPAKEPEKAPPQQKKPEQQKPEQKKPEQKKQAAPSAPSPASAGNGAEVADAFARGNVTLGAALGVGRAERDLLKQRAFSLLQEQRMDLAGPLLEGLVALDPFDAWALTALAGIKLDSKIPGDIELARALLDRAVQVAPADVTARALRAEARARTGDVVGAKEDLKAIAKADATLPAVKRARALETALKKA